MATTAGLAGEAPLTAQLSASRNRLELVALLALVIAAALIRLPHLWSIPQFSDETLDSVWSFEIYQGRRLPLHSVAKYVGPIESYTEALGYRLFGPDITTPRLMVWLVCSAAVATTYLLAREILGRPAAWLAAALLATSGVHLAGNSHVAWAQMTGPTWLALALALLYRAVRRRHGWTLVAAGFVFGLVLQTALWTVAYLPGAALFLLWRGFGLFRTRWPYLALGAFLLAYSPMIAYNLGSGFESIKSGQSRDAAYGDYRVRGLESYLANQGRLVLTVLRFPASAVDARPAASDYLTDPQVLLFAGLAAAGVVLLAAKGSPLPALVIASAVLIFPFFGAHHELLPRQGRYLAGLLPLLYVGLAGAVWAAVTGIVGVMERKRDGEKESTISASRRLFVFPSLHLSISPSLVLAAVSLPLVLLPLLPLQRYYSESVADGETNERFFTLLTHIEAARQHDELVLLDFQLAQESLGGGGTALRTMDFMLTFRHIPSDDLDIDPEKLARRYPRGGLVLVLAEKTWERVGSLLPLLPAPGQTNITPPNPYGVYLLGPSDTDRRRSS